MTFEQGYIAVRNYAEAAIRTAWPDVAKVYVGPMRQEPKDYPHGAVWRSDAVVVANETPSTDTATVVFDVVGRFDYGSGSALDGADLDGEIVGRWNVLAVALNASDHPGTWVGEAVGFLPQVQMMIENLATPDEKHFEVGCRWTVTISFLR